MVLIIWILIYLSRFHTSKHLILEFPVIIIIIIIIIIIYFVLGCKKLQLDMSTNNSFT
jgi:hypothetical protein